MPINLYHIAVRAKRGGGLDVKYTTTNAISEEAAWFYALVLCVQMYPDGSGWTERQYCVDSADWRDV
jgi:hypothetical protein